MNAYRTFNLVVLGFLLYALLFPLISPLMEKLLPNVWRCYYKDITGNPCPFCGLTSDMSSFLHRNRAQINGWNNSHFPIFLTAYTVEWAIRIPMLLISRRFTGRRLPVIDTALHTIIAVVVFYAL